MVKNKWYERSHWTYKGNRGWLIERGSCHFIGRFSCDFISGDVITGDVITGDVTIHHTICLKYAPIQHDILLTGVIHHQNP